MITIHPYYLGVERELFNIFTSAIRDICIKDYSQEQINAWLPSEYRSQEWKKRLEGINPYIAMLDENIAGYADIQEDGYIDHFFVGAKYQSQGIGKALMNSLLGNTKSERAYSHVSITAKPFFEKNGFVVVKENTAVIRGVELRNFVMERWSR
jgi:putative acetyltransferase